MIPVHTIPTLAREVPRTLVTRSEGSWLPVVAGALARGGALEFPEGGNALPAKANTELKLIEAGLQNWWTRLCAPLALFNFDLAVAQCPPGIDDAGMETKYGPALHLIVLHSDDVSIGDIPRFEIGTRISELNDECPGLGETVLAALYDALHFVPGVNTPQDTLHHTMWTWWGGEQDESNHLEFMREESDTPITMAEALDSYGGPTREYFDRMIPRWVQMPKRRCSRDEAAFRCRSKRARKVITALDNMVDTAHANRPLHVNLTGTTGFCTGVSLFLNWDRDELAYRAFDDMANEAANAGEDHNYLSVYTLPPEPVAIRRWKSAMSQSLHLARATEDLIKLIGVPCE